MANDSKLSNEEMIRQITVWLDQRVHEIATEEMNKARERLRQRIPELAAEIGIRLQSALSLSSMDAVLQIVLRPKI